MKEIIDFLKKYTDGKKNTEKVEISVLQLNRAIKALEQESKTGRWISDDRDDFLWKCSNCNHNSGYLGNRFSKPKYNFCPNCGPKMMVEEDNE